MADPDRWKRSRNKRTSQVRLRGRLADDALDINIHINLVMPDERANIGMLQHDVL
jgi:hypothetical protein